jgi:hypothetical protein
VLWLPCPACERIAGVERRASGSVFLHGPYAGDDCMGDEVSEAEAMAVRRIRQDGGERFRLAAHP